MRVSRTFVLTCCLGFSSLPFSSLGLADATSPKSFICVIGWASATNFQYVELKKLKVGKNSYGSVSDVLPKLVDQARNLGADAIINYNGAQRFGFFPWRFVRPVVTGTAVKLNEPVDCAAAGGMLL